MRRVPIVMVCVLLFSALPVAHGQGMQGPSWEMGWVTDVDPKYIVDLEEDWDLTGELVVYVKNDGPTSVNVELTYDYDENGPFRFNGPESISVGGNGNETFTIAIIGADADTVRAFSPSSVVEFTVTGDEKVGESSLRSQVIEADVTVPRMYRLIPDVVEPTDTLFAGSWVDFTLEVSNMGNTQDAITAGDAVIRGCPHLLVSGLDQLENKVVQVTNAKGDNKASFTLRLEAGSTHQERSCEVSIVVQSEGDGSERSSTFDVQVKAPAADEIVVEESDEEGNSPPLPETSSLPGFVFLEVMLVLVFVTLVRRRVSQ